MKLEAASRLKSTLVTAAPVSLGEQERFIMELMKLDPVLAAGTFDKSFGREDRTKLFVNGKKNGLRAINVILKHGWKKDGTWNKNFASEFPLLSRDGLWPIYVRINPLGVSFKAPTDDTVDDDSAFRDLLMRMAKAVLPGGAILDLRTGTAEWRKSGGHAGANVVSKSVQKAKALGFKPASSLGSSHPAGDWVSRDETYVHPDGWILSYGSSYGQTKSQNSFWIRLSVDYRRGEDLDSGLPKAGEWVRYHDASFGYDRVGTVVSVRNARLQVYLGSTDALVDATQLKPVPKEGSVVVYQDPVSKVERRGTLDSLAYGYMVVKTDRGNMFVKERSVVSVGGDSWK